MDEVLGTPSGKLSSCSGGVPARLLMIGAVIGTSAGTQRAWSQTEDVFVQKMLMAKPSGILRWHMGQACGDREGQWQPVREMEARVQRGLWAGEELLNILGRFKLEPSLKIPRRE